MSAAPSSSDEHSPKVDRRTLLVGGVSAITAGAVLARPATAHEGAGLHADGHVFVGKVVAPPGPDGFDAVRLSSDRRIRIALQQGATVIDENGDEVPVEQLRVGQTIAAEPATDALAEAEREGTVPAERIVPVILGVRSDVVR